MRTRVVGVSVCVVALLVDPSLAGRSDGQGMAGQTPQSWLQLRGGTDNSGAVSASLAADWRFTAPLPVRGISVAEDLVLIGSESADAESKEPFGDERGFLAALDAVTGRIRWGRSVATWIHGDPLVFNGRVYATLGRWPMTFPGGLVAVDIRNGRTIWSYSAPAGFMPAAAIDSEARTITALGGDGVLTTLALSDGHVVAEAGTRNADGMSSPRMLRDGVAFFGAGDAVISYSTRSRHQLWVYTTSGLRDFGDVPVAVSDSLIFTTGSRAIDPWRAARGLPLSEFLLLLRQGRANIGISKFRSWFHEQWLIALDRQTGRERWRAPLGIGLSIPRNQSGTPVIVGDRVIVSSPISKVVWAFAAESGRVIWRTKMSATHKGAVTIVPDGVLLGDAAGRITLLALSTGQVLGSCSTPAGFSVTAPLIVGSTLLAVTRDGAVYAERYDRFRGHLLLKGSSCF